MDTTMHRSNPVASGTPAVPPRQLVNLALRASNRDAEATLQVLRHRFEQSSLHFATDGIFLSFRLNTRRHQMLSKFIITNLTDESVTQDAAPAAMVAGSAETPPPPGQADLSILSCSTYEADERLEKLRQQIAQTGLGVTVIGPHLTIRFTTEAGYRAMVSSILVHLSDTSLRRAPHPDDDK